MKKQLKIYADETTISKFKKIATLNRRNYSAELEIAMEKVIADYEATHGEIQVEQNSRGGD